MYDQLISAGVDTKIVFKSISDKLQSHSIRKYNSMPQVSLRFNLIGDK